jgi:hypothetical protein
MSTNRLEQIINLKLNNFEIKKPDVNPVAKEPIDAEIEPNPCWEGYEPIGLKEDGSPNCVPIKAAKIDLADYPWDTCIQDQIERYGDEEIAKKVCGSIKALYGSKIEMKENFVIPNPSGDEDQNTFISRCVSEISGEYEQEQALGICYSQWEKK